MYRLSILGVFVLLCIVSVNAFAQDEPESTPEPALADTIHATFQSTNLSPPLGVPTDLTIVVDLPPEAELIEFPEFPDVWGDFMVREVGELNIETLDNGHNIYTQTLTLILWDVGDFDPPDTFVGYQLDGVDEVYYVPVGSVSFFVPSMLNPDMNQNELRPLKPQISFFYIPLWLIAGCVVFVGGSGWAGYRWYQRKQANRQPVKVTPIDPITIARSTLSKINSQSMTPNEAYDAIYNVLKQYLMTRLGIVPNQIFTDEMWRVLSHKLDSVLVDEFHQIAVFLEEVRFAPTESGAKSVERLLERCEVWLSAVDKSLGLDGEVSVTQ